MIGLETLERVGGKIKATDQTIELIFANGTKELVSTIAYINVVVGSFNELIPFMVCDIGEQAIRGVSFFKDIKLQLDWANQTF